MREICWFSPGYRSAYFFALSDYEFKAKGSRNLPKIIVGNHFGFAHWCSWQMFCKYLSWYWLCEHLHKLRLGFHLNDSFSSRKSILHIPFLYFILALQFWSLDLHMQVYELFEMNLGVIQTKYVKNKSSKIFTLQIITDKPT